MSLEQNKAIVLKLYEAFDQKDVEHRLPRAIALILHLQPCPHAQALNHTSSGAWSSAPLVKSVHHASQSRIAVCLGDICLDDL